ncbi:MAG: hypothetical protein AB7U20_03875 [Planctomycetaceae bacterium]
MAPSARLQLAARDWEILRTLSLCVRMLSLRQISRTWWGCCESGHQVALDRLNRLVRGGWLWCRHAFAQPLSPLMSPQASWHSGQWIPDFGPLAWRLRQRWDCPAEPVKIYLATSRTARHFGGRRRDVIARPFQIAHDLGVAEMFLAVRQQRPHLVRWWIDEDRLAPFRRRQKLPDAVLAESPRAPIQLVLEFGAGYSKQRLAAFHRDSESRGLPYEIW